MLTTTILVRIWTLVDYLQSNYVEIFNTGTSPPNQLNNIVFSKSMIERQCRNLNAQSVPGPDEIHHRVLKTFG